MREIAAKRREVADLRRRQALRGCGNARIRRGDARVGSLILLAPAFDLGIARALAGIDVEGPMPAFWNEFDALANVPMLVIRGANSDMLSAETVAAMRARRSEMELIEVPDQGHAPLLEGDLVRQIVKFVENCEGAG